MCELNMLLKSDINEKDFKKNLSDFIDKHSSSVSKPVPRCKYCNTMLLTNEYELEYVKLEHPSIKDTDFCSIDCIKDYFIHTLMWDSVKKNAKLDINYITQFNSEVAARILDLFDRKEILEFIQNDLYTFLFSEEKWKELYSSIDEIPKKDLVDEIISSYYEF